MTGLGRSELPRTYFACPGRGQGGAHADRLLGLDSFLTRQATRLVDTAAITALGDGAAWI